MAGIGRRRCSIGGCPHMIDADKLMCRIHWRLVSTTTAREVTRTWRAYARVRRVRSADDVVALARSQYERARDAALIEAAREPGRELAGV